MMNVTKSSEIKAITIQFDDTEVQTTIQKKNNPTSQIETRDLNPTPPDGGWGWMVVLGSFMISFFADGFTYTFGIFYVYILQEFDASRSSASWIASILVGVTLSSGPISSSLVNRLGCRSVTMIGGFVASFFIFISIYAKSVVYLYFTIGIGTGLGLGLIYLPAIVCVTEYFEKKRSFATGIAVCGSGFGTFVFSPLVKYCIELYAWKGALFVMAGIMLNCICFGALFRPLKPKLSEDKKTQEDVNKHLENVTKNAKKERDIDIFAKSLHSAPMRREFSFRKSFNCQRDLMIQTKGKRTISEGNENQGFVNSDLVPLPEIRRSFEEKKTFTAGRKFTLRATESTQMKNEESNLQIENYSNGFHDQAAVAIELPYLDQKLDCKMKVCGCVPLSRKTKNDIYDFLNIDLLSNRVLQLFILSNFAISIGFNAPYVFLVDRAIGLGIDSNNASLLLSIIGITNTIARVILGYISDKPWVNRLLLYNLSLTSCGIATGLSIFFTDYTTLAIYATLYGTASSAFVGLTSVVLVDLLGMKNITNALGLSLFSQGLASFIGPPVCGFLFDITQSYDYSFLFAGTVIALSGLMLFLMPYAHRAQKYRENSLKCKEHFANSSALR